MAAPRGLSGAAPELLQLTLSDGRVGCSDRLALAATAEDRRPDGALTRENPHCGKFGIFQRERGSRRMVETPGHRISVVEPPRPPDADVGSAPTPRDLAYPRVGSSVLVNAFRLAKSGVKFRILR